MLLKSQMSTVFESSWQGFGGVHGGLLLGTLADSAARELQARPAAITAHFYAPVAPGPVDIAVDVVHPGRSGSARAEIAGSVTALVRTQRGPSGELSWPRTAAPVPDSDPESLERIAPMVDLVPFARHLDIRPTDDARPHGERSELVQHGKRSELVQHGGTRPQFEAWIRLLDDSGFSAELRSSILLDSLPPGLYAMTTRPVPVPTIEMTAHFVPHTDVGPWHFIRHRTVWATADLTVDETELYTATGELAAQARQLRRIAER